MPVSGGVGQYPMEIGRAHQSVQYRNNPVAFFDCECTPWAEITLNIHYEDRYGLSVQRIT